MPANGDGSRLKEGNNFRRIYRLLFWVIFNSQLIKYAKQTMFLDSIVLRFTNFRRRKHSFSSPIPRKFELPIENNKHPNFEWRGQWRGVDYFVL